MGVESADHDLAPDPRVGWVVALEGDPDQFVGETERDDDLCGGREQRDDPHVDSRYRRVAGAGANGAGAGIDRDLLAGGEAPVAPATLVTAGSPSSRTRIEPWERSPPISTTTAATDSSVEIHPASIERATSTVSRRSKPAGSAVPGSSRTHADPSRGPSSVEAHGAPRRALRPRDATRRDRRSVGPRAGRRGHRVLDVRLTLGPERGVGSPAGVEAAGLVGVEQPDVVDGRSRPSRPPSSASATIDRGSSAKLRIASWRSSSRARSGWVRRPHQIGSVNHPAHRRRGGAPVHGRHGMRRLRSCDQRRGVVAVARAGDVALVDATMTVVDRGTERAAARRLGLGRTAAAGIARRHLGGHRPVAGGVFEQRAGSSGVAASGGPIADDSGNIPVTSVT